MHPGCQSGQDYCPELPISAGASGRSGIAVKCSKRSKALKALKALTYRK